MLEKHAIEETTPRGHGFLSTIFLVKPSPLLQMMAEPIKPVCMFQHHEGNSAWWLNHHLVM